MKPAIINETVRGSNLSDFIKSMYQPEQADMFFDIT